MKKTLAYDGNAKQFKTDIDGKRFYLGGDAAQADQRKLAIAKYHQRSGDWTNTTLDVAKKMAKGEDIRLAETSNEIAYHLAEEQAIRQGVPVHPVATSVDLLVVELAMLREQNQKLMTELKEVAGPRVAQRSTIKFSEVLLEWHQYRKETAVNVGTSTPTDACRGEGNVINFIIRQIEPAGQKLADMDYACIDKLAKKIASRPLSLTSGLPVSRAWARESLKILRRVIRWAGRTYGYRKPDDWDYAARGEIKFTKSDQLKRQDMATKIYSTDEIRTLYKYAIPSERLILLLALNCGFRQREITALQASEIEGTRIARYRDKSDVYAEWNLWPETVSALASTNRPAQRSKVTRMWHRLIDRIQKDQPNFRRLSLKRICKTGATKIRQIASGEVASMYVSHGEHTNDDLLGVYAAADWQRLHDALAIWHQELALGETAPVTSARTYVPLSKIERCRELWATDVPVNEIIKQTGFSRATVYRYRPQLEAVHVPVNYFTDN